MSTPTVYVICDNNCKYEGMTKEQILSAITQAVENGEITDIDKGFITTVLTINNVSLRFFYGEQSAYDALTEAQKENLYAIITNDTFKADVNEALEQLETSLTELRKGLLNGTLAVGKLASGNCYAKSGSIGETLSGVSLEAGKAYLIVLAVGYTYYTVSLYVHTSNVAIYSTATYNGYYCLYNHKTKTLAFYYDGTAASVSSIYIREL